jgi:hypothetical protein
VFGDYAPAATRLTWRVLPAIVAGIVAVLSTAEPGAKRTDVLTSLRPRIAVPQQAWGTFAGAIPSAGVMPTPRFLRAPSAK